MYIIRDIFYLKFGHYRDAKALLDQASSQNLLPQKALQTRILSDFTGKSYRLIFEESFETLAEYEKSLTDSMATPEWQSWYAQFKTHIERGEREILKQVM